MRMKEYNAYKKREAKVIYEINEYKVNEKILNYLESNGFNIKDTDISYLSKMVTKIVFNYRMFGKEFSDNILKNNPLYIFNVFGNNASPDIKNDVNSLLRRNSINDNLVDYIDEVADNVNSMIDDEIELKKQDNKKLAYAVQ